jgi:hypothetical protein
MHAPLARLKRVFTEGLEYSISSSGFYIQPNTKLCAEQLKDVASAQNYQDLIWSFQIHNYIRLFGYEQRPKIPERDLLRFTALNVESTVQTRYVISGGSEFHRFAITISCCSIAPPAIVKSNGLSETDGLAWYVSGGVTDRNIWYQIPEEWLEETSYDDTFANHQFLFDGKSARMHIVFGNPERLLFKLNLIFRDDQDQEHQVMVTLQARARPKYVYNDLPSEVFRQISFIYCDMSLQLSVNGSPEARGLGFVQKIELSQPPNTFLPQTLFVLTVPRTFISVPPLLLFLQFESYQYLLETSISEPFFVGMLLNLEGVRYAFDVATTATKHAELTISELVYINGQAFPKAIQVVIDHHTAISGDAGAGVAVVLNVSMQADFQATMAIRDMDENHGFALLRVNNILSADKWATLSLGDAKWGPDLLNQPIIVHRPLAMFIVYVLPVLIVAILVLIVYYVSFAIRKSKIK